MICPNCRRDRPKTFICEQALISLADGAVLATKRVFNVCCEDCGRSVVDFPFGNHMASGDKSRERLFPRKHVRAIVARLDEKYASRFKRYLGGFLFVDSAEMIVYLNAARHVIPGLGWSYFPPSAAGVEFIAENGGGAGVLLIRP